jgi:CBS domain-containing protein
MRIADVMTKDLPRVAPEDHICDAAARMASRGVQALPVCEDDRLVGIVTDWDVTRAVANGPDGASRPVADHMSTELVTTEPDARLMDASELMGARRIHHLVVQQDGCFAGMVHLDVDWSELGGMESPIASFSAPI